MTTDDASPLAEAIVAAGTAGLAYTLPVTYAIVILLGVLVISNLHRESRC